MPDFRQSGEKPTKSYELGPNVTTTSEKLENDLWASNLLKDIGSTMAPAPLRYMGSIAVHYYRSDSDLLTGTYELATKCQICTGDVSEKVVSSGIGDLMVALKQYYGRKHSTTDTRDKRGTL